MAGQFSTSATVDLLQIHSSEPEGGYSKTEAENQVRETWALADTEGWQSYLSECKWQWAGLAHFWLISESSAEGKIGNIQSQRE